ncbi:MAG: BREX-1 system adenine-specific DNA-methyltransferase PglX [Chitinophagales bacterium]|nr:BREX-1 system adenine-specific DNA-methyltransferase PglX [Chitinophagales bacterium]
MTSKDEAYKKISALVKRFDEQKEFYRRQDYNETLTRIDFINPFFKARVDTDNEQGFAESYREVIHEDKLKVAGQTKAPDYCFKYGDRRLFFVEAKKPSVSVKDDISPAYQLRRYGWTAKLPISIITDFEEFAIYDCTKKPNPTDKASNGRIKYFTYTDYINEFDFIWETFSKERVLKGSFDKFALSNKNKKGTTTVDSEFLLSLDEWRKQLALNIALRNHIEEDELNFIVQHIIDRIIFLRIAEDRNIEPYANLQDTITSGDYYQNLLKLFYTADQKYNSGLFDFKKDKTSSNIVIDNKVIKSIINELYYPICPYEFSVLSVEILGSAYEQFLGKTISLSKNGKAVIEEKPEVRKAGGIYYTPQYIVDYIVKNTVGKLIENKTPKEISNIKICDPACGSGSFLIGAYQFLLNYHKDYYSKNVKPSKGNKDNPLTPEGNLTTAEKKRILLNNIFGVDLDANAVEVTKLSLLLKCMEGETEASIATQLKLFHERVLPTLDNNIKCGNSLIDLDYYDNELDFGEERKVKPFSWQKAFPEVFNRNVEATEKETINQLTKKVKHHAKKVIEYTTELEERISHAFEPTMQYAVKGGFDCIIGNPPYISLQRNFLIQNEYEYFLKHYDFTEKILDTYSLFLQKGQKILNSKGCLGFIIPSTFSINLSFKNYRKKLLEKKLIREIVLLGDGVFKDAVVPTMLIFIEKSNNIRIIGNIKKFDSDFTEMILTTKDFSEEQNYEFSLKSEYSSILKKISKNKETLNAFIDIKEGIKTGNDSKFLSEKPNSKNSKPVLKGRDIDKYYLNSKLYIDYNIEELSRPQKREHFETEKLLIRRVGKNIIATYDNTKLFCVHTLYTARLKEYNNQVSLKYLLALLNSKLINFYHNELYSKKGNTFSEIRIYVLNNLPIAKANEKQQSEIIKLVDQLLQLNKDLQTETLPNRIEQLKNRIEYAEDKINQIVYELYGLTQSEINLIENS